MALVPCQKVAAGHRERREGIGVNMLLAGHTGEQESKRLGLQLAANNQNLLPISLCLD